jgi:hypothetical protein
MIKTASKPKGSTTSAILLIFRRGLQSALFLDLSTASEPHFSAMSSTSDGTT